MDRILTIAGAGTRFHGQLRGTDARTVFLHGFAGDLHTWDGLWENLGVSLPALRYDLRGFGRTPGGADETYSHADDLLAVLDGAGIERADLVGVSMGGGIALNFALDHPGRVGKVVLISPGLVAWEWSEDWRALWQPVVELARAARMDEARRLWWQHPLFATTRDSDGGPALREALLRYPGSHWIRDSHRLMLPDVERLHHLDARTLLLTGGRDLAEFRLIAELIEASVNDLVRIELPECGHLLQLENPAECARRILAFLDVPAPGPD